MSVLCSFTLIGSVKRAARRRMLQRSKGREPSLSTAAHAYVVRLAFGVMPVLWIVSVSMTICGHTRLAARRSPGTRSRCADTITPSKGSTFTLTRGKSRRSLESYGSTHRLL